MQLLIDFLPIVLFFAAYFISNDFYTALLVIMVAAPIAFALQWVLTKTFNKLSAISTLLVVVLGGGTLLLDNKMIFLLKATPDAMKSGFILNMAWVVFFAFAGALNIYVAYMYSEPTWVKFKLFGLIGLTIVFIIAQSFWLAKQINDESEQ